TGTADFSESPLARVYPGDSVILAWDTVGATAMTITNPQGVVQPVTGSQAMVQPRSAGLAEYTLTVQNAAGSAQAKASVLVFPVRISAFSATPTTVAAGRSAQLAWRIEGANFDTRIVIDPGVGRVEKVGTRSVAPLQTTEFRLLVTD